jgi:cell division protein FtsN
MSGKDDDTLGSFYMGRMKPGVEPRRVLPKGLLTVVTLLSFIAIIWYAYPTGQEKFAGKDIPLIAADKTAYKFKPEDPGGMEVPHQDSTVFAPLEKGGEKTVEKLRPAPEEPMDKDALIQPMKKPPIDTAPKALALTPLQEVPEKVEALVSPPQSQLETPKPQPKPDTAKPDTAKKDDKKTDAKPEVKAEAKPAVKPEMAKTETAKPAAPKPAQKAETKPSVVAVETQPLAPLAPATPAPQVANTPPAKGGVYIQLGAYRDLAGAKDDWVQLQKKYTELKGLSMHTEVVKIAGKGTLTRLQAGKVAEARAKEICSLMKARGNSGCMVVR